MMKRRRRSFWLGADELDWLAERAEAENRTVNHMLQVILERLQDWQPPTECPRCGCPIEP